MPLKREEEVVVGVGGTKALANASVAPSKATAGVAGTIMPVVEWEGGREGGREMVSEGMEWMDCGCGARARGLWWCMERRTRRGGSGLLVVMMAASIKERAGATTTAHEDQQPKTQPGQAGTCW